MKSSGPLFTTQNPFLPAPRVGKTHYHPTCNQSLSRKKKKTALSPVRSHQPPSPQENSQQSSDERDDSFVAVDGRLVLSESWPSTDCGSSPASTAATSHTETHKQSARAGESTGPSEPGFQQDSMLAKYVERFRHGQPQSREERQQTASAIGEEELPFWWMSPSSLNHSSRPTKTAYCDLVTQPLRQDHVPTVFGSAGQRCGDRSPSPCRGSMSLLSDTSQGEFDDTEILNLQERASRLLLRGYEDHDCSLSDGSVLVSAEGLECSDYSSPFSMDEPVQRPVMHGFMKSTTAKASSSSFQAVSSQKSTIPSLGLPTRPEEDILFKWRLRRKMEEARDWTQNLQPSSRRGATLSWQPSSLRHPTAGEQELAYKQQPSTPSGEFSQKETHPQLIAPQPDAKESLGAFLPVPCPSPSPACSQRQPITRVPAHMHFLCDVLPCPIQLSHASTEQNVSRSSDEFHTEVGTRPIKTRVPDDPTDILTDEPFREPNSSSKHASSGAKKEEWPAHHKRSETKREENARGRESEKNEKKPATSIRNPKKTMRYTVDRDGHNSPKRRSAKQKPPKKATPLAEPQKREPSQGFSSGSCIGDHAPPPSPVHSALAQAVSEVLFPPLDSSPARRSPRTLISPPRIVSTPGPSTVPPCNTQNSVEVISQLLQEAEDSDENEFEDDPLLQVLRKQRTWVKEQISEVESMLTEFQDEQQVT